MCNPSCIARVTAKRWSGFDSWRRGGLSLGSGLQQRLIHNLGLVGAKIRRLGFVGNKRRGLGRREEIGLDRFKEGPFGQYLEMIQPIRVHGMLIYNLLKRQLICPEEEKDDEMWFGLGEKKARFGREEFCLCSGLNMGTLPKGSKKKKKSVRNLF
ncbi:hypothetical protein LWI29_011554 [Acer saccharum]|uniref:Uncharacterized protein n=1 Tax=Acer saccharum TaxID=4024 RepID=A0AA39RVU3_ACESA|nr:hypothetical protein LWI29_011554 [Acer saccharum]